MLEEGLQTDCDMDTTLYEEQHSSMPVRTCVQCGYVCHTRCKVCRGCGHLFPPSKKRVATGPPRKYATDLLSQLQKKTNQLHELGYDVVVLGHKANEVHSSYPIMSTHGSGREFLAKYPQIIKLWKQNFKDHRSTVTSSTITTPTTMNAVMSSEPITTSTTTSMMNAVMSSEPITTSTTTSMMNAVMTSEPITTSTTTSMMNAVMTSEPITTSTTTSMMNAVMTSEPITTSTTTSTTMNAVMTSEPIATSTTTSTTMNAVMTSEPIATSTTMSTVTANTVKNRYSGQTVVGSTPARAGSASKKRRRCGNCAKCKAPKCGRCKFCLQPSLKRACVERQCILLTN